MTSQPQITVSYDKAAGVYAVSFDSSNVFGPQANNTYPVPGDAFDPRINFGTIASDLLRRFPVAQVIA